MEFSDLKADIMKAIHDTEMQSISIRHKGDIDPDRFLPWLNELVQREGPDILRCKGIIAFKNEPRRFVFQGVHMLFDAKFDREWGGQPRQNTLVFIGKNLERAKLTEQFKACLA